MKNPQPFVFFFSIVIVLPITITAQNFSWTSAAVNTGLEYSMRAMSANRQELCVGGEAQQLNYRMNEPGLYNSTGEEQLDAYGVDNPGGHMFVYDFSGKLKWHQHFHYGQSTLINFTYDYKDVLTALIYQQRSEEYDYYEDDEEEDGDEDYEKDTRGYCLYYYDSAGRNTKVVRIPELLNVEITDFKSHPSGGFVIAGHADDKKIATNIALETGPAGCDFILFINAEGHVTWGDVLSYQKETCCTYGADPELALDEKGTIYLGGSYVGGARFGGKVIKLAPVPYNPGKYYTAMEAYVAAYSANGKFLWVNTAGVQSYFTGLAAAQGYVYIATRASKTGTLYSERVDTAEHQHVFITAFTSKGKFKRNISTGSGGKVFLSTDAAGNLVATGTIGIETGYLARPAGEDKSKWRKEDSFVTFFIPGGEYKQHFLFDMLVIPSDDPAICMAVSPDVFFLTGNLFGSLSITLRAIDKGFPDVTFSASAPFVARWKVQ